MKLFILESFVMVLIIIICCICIIIVRDKIESVEGIFLPSKHRDKILMPYYFIKVCIALIMAFDLVGLMYLIVNRGF